MKKDVRVFPWHFLYNLIIKMILLLLQSLKKFKINIIRFHFLLLNKYILADVLINNAGC